MKRSNKLIDAQLGPWAGQANFAAKPFAAVNCSSNMLAMPLIVGTFFLLLLYCNCAVNSADHREHASQWSVESSASDESIITLKLLIRHSNAQLLEEKLYSVSDPRSSDYQNYLSNDEIKSLISPSESVISSINSYLHGSADSIEWSNYNDYCTVKLTAKSVRDKFHSEVYLIKDVNREKTSFITEFTSAELIALFPTDVQPHIVQISGATIYPFSRLHKKNEFLSQSSYAATSIYPPTDYPLVSVRVLDGELEIYFTIICPDRQSVMKYYEGGTEMWCDTTEGRETFQAAHVYYQSSADSAQRRFNGDLESAVFDNGLMVRAKVKVANYLGYRFQCVQKFSSRFYTLNYDWFIASTQYKSPDMLKYLYNFPEYLPTNSSARQAIFSANLQDPNGAEQGFYNPQDLSEFAYYFNLISAENSISWSGEDSSDYNNPQNLDTETQLDIQYITGTGQNISTTIFHTTSRVTIFLDVMQRIQALPDNEIPHVLSISYGGSELVQGDINIQHLDAQFQAMGLRGISILISSGDTGAYKLATDSNRHIDFAATCAKFIPTYPASSSFVTAVGATQWYSRNASSCPYQVPSSLKTGSDFTSGGGFSSSQPRPKYQQNLVNKYLNDPHCIKPALISFNSSNRGFPDISFDGSFYSVFNNYYINQKISAVSGTSASAPALAGIISLFNDKRMKLGLKSLGFLNPLLYQIAANHSEAFTDITSGDNGCLEFGICCPNYYTACAKNWDPVSGLGAPIFDILGQYLVPGGITGSKRHFRIDGCDGQNTGDDNGSGSSDWSDSGSESGSGSPTGDTHLYIFGIIGGVIGLVILAVGLKICITRRLAASRDASVQQPPVRDNIYQRL
jgi:hypothetical protein